jgi:hypothetical protein
MTEQTVHRLGKLHRYSEIMSGTWDAPNYPICPHTYSLAVIWLWRVIMGPTEYCTMILLPKPSQNLPHVSLLEPSIPDCRHPWVISWCTEQCKRMTHLTISHALLHLSDVHVLWLRHYCVHIWALLSVIRGLAIAALAFMLDLWNIRHFLWKQADQDEYSVLLSVTCAAVLWFF